MGVSQMPRALPVGLHILDASFHFKKLKVEFNTNAERVLTFGSIPPSPRPLPSGERGRVRGANLKEFNAFVLVTPRLWLQPGPVRIFGRYGTNLGMIKGCQVPLVMKQRVAHTPACPSDVARTMHPIRIGFGVWRRTNMEMNIAGVGMLDYPAVDKAGALMRSDDRLWMNATVYFGKVVDTFA